MHKRFKKSSVAWHYRRSVFLLAFTRQIEKLKDKLRSKIKVEGDDFNQLKAFLTRESDRLDDIILKHGRSYKIWEYYIHILYYSYRQLTDFRVSIDSEFKDITLSLKESIESELEIFIV